MIIEMIMCNVSENRTFEIDSGNAFLVNRMRKMAPWPVDWIDTSEAIARRAASLLEQAGEPVLADEALAEKGEDVAIFTSGIPDFSTRKLLSGFGLTSCQPL